MRRLIIILFGLLLIESALAQTGPQTGPSGGGGTSGGGSVVLPGQLTQLKSTAVGSSIQLCAASCNLSRITTLIRGTSGYLMLFQNMTSCPINGPVTPDAAFAIGSDGTRGGLVLKYDPGQEFFAVGGLVACFSSGTDEYTMIANGSASFFAGVAPASGPAVGQVKSVAQGNGLQVCTTSCNLARLTTLIHATSGYMMLFDQTGATCPANGSVSPAFAVPINSNTLNGMFLLKFDPGQELHAASGLVACFSTGANEYTMAQSSTASFFAGIK